MATEIIVRKLYNSIVPVDAANAELFEELQANGEYKAVFTRPRNLAFHRKAFALLSVVYNAWDMPERKHKGQPVAKNVEGLREDMTILAGYYTVEYKYDGSLRLKAKSWSFAKMSEEEFSAMYSKLIDAALAKILNNYRREDIEQQVNNILGFC